LARAKSKSSSALTSHSLVISESPIQDFAVFEDRFQEWIAHFKPLLKFLWPVYEKVDGDMAVDQPAQLPDSICAIVRRPALDDKEVCIAVRSCISSGCAPEKNDFFGSVFLDDLDCDAFDFSLEIHFHSIGLLIVIR
jgi:hypothetical protein